MKTQVNIKKLTIRLRILKTEVLEFYRGSFFGVRAMDPEVLHLWLEYNNLLSEFHTIYPSLLSEFKELPYPDPELASDDSFYKEGTMIYKPEHFTQMRLELNKVISIISNAPDRMIA